MSSTFFASVCPSTQTNERFGLRLLHAEAVDRQDVAGFDPLAQRFLKSEPPDRLRNFLGVIARLRAEDHTTATPDRRTTCNRHARARCLFAATAWRRKDSRRLSSSCSPSRNDAPRASRRRRRAPPGFRGRLRSDSIFASFAASTVKNFRAHLLRASAATVSSWPGGRRHSCRSLRGRRR